MDTETISPTTAVPPPRRSAFPGPGYLFLALAVGFVAGAMCVNLGEMKQALRTGAGDQERYRVTVTGAETYVLVDSATGRLYRRAAKWTGDQTHPATQSFAWEEISPDWTKPGVAQP